MTDILVIELVDPLPCGAWAPDGTCNRPAYAGYAVPDRVRPGAWTVMPVCEKCATGTTILYGVLPWDTRAAEAYSHKEVQP